MHTYTQKKRKNGRNALKLSKLTYNPLEEQMNAQIYLGRPYGCLFIGSQEEKSKNLH